VRLLRINGQHPCRPFLELPPKLKDTAWPGIGFQESCCSSHELLSSRLFALLFQTGVTKSFFFPTIAPRLCST